MAGSSFVRAELRKLRYGLIGCLRHSSSNALGRSRAGAMTQARQLMEFFFSWAKQPVSTVLGLFECLEKWNRADAASRQKDNFYPIKLVATAPVTQDHGFDGSFAFPYFAFRPVQWHRERA